MSCRSGTGDFVPCAAAVGPGRAQQQPRPATPSSPRSAPSRASPAPAIPNIENKSMCFFQTFQMRDISLTIGSAIDICGVATSVMSVAGAAWAAGVAGGRGGPWLPLHCRDYGWFQGSSPAAPVVTYSPQQLICSLLITLSLSWPPLGCHWGLN